MRKMLLLSAMLVLYAVLAFAQSREVTGTVTDPSGQPIPGASIRVKGAKGGTSADQSGSFKLIISGNSTLIISATGYAPQEVFAGDQASLSIRMSQDGKNLSEVVVTALGISREKKAINYSAQTVTSENISNGGRANLLDDINGKVAGVQITNAGGQAGSGTTVVIRGYNSLTGNNQPLYVVDGVPIDNTSEQGDPTNTSPYNTPTANRAVDINPDDIESLTILKGGAATALYGIQAANGALIITTKRGRSGKLNIEASYGHNESKANKFLDFSQGFLRGTGGIYNTSTTNNWGPTIASNPVFPNGTHLDLDGKGDKDVSGQKIPYFGNNYQNFFVTGKTNRYGLSLSGGNDKTVYYAGFSRMDQGGIMPNNTYDKTSATFNFSTQVSPRFNLNAKINYINTGGLRFNSSAVMNGLNYYVNTWNINTFPWKDSLSNETWWQPTISSPEWLVHEGGEHYRINRYIANIGADYKIARDWSLNYRYGLDNYAESRKAADPIGTLNTFATNYLGAMHEVRVNSLQVNSDLVLNYNHAFGENFRLHALAGNNVFYKRYDVVDQTGISFVVPNLFDITNTMNQTTYHSSFQKMTMGIYGALQMSYKDFLFLESSLRNDWSSTLPRNNNHFIYPSVSAGFVFSDFINADWFSYGKLRVGYAGTANDAPVNALRVAYVIQTPQIRGNTRLSYPATEPDGSLKPEHTNQKEIGVDLGFFKRKVYLEATYYSKRSFDQIIYAPTSPAVGVTSQLINLGETTNKGVDATLTFKDVVASKNFSWTSAFNFSRNVSKVIRVSGGSDKVGLAYGQYATTAEIDAKVGQSFGAIYAPTWQHYGVSKDDPNYRKAPLVIGDDGQPAITSDKVLLGNTSPKFILGWNNTMNYKNISLGFTLEWKHGGDVLNDFNNIETYSGKSALTQDRWYSDTYEGANKYKTFSGVDATGKAKTGTPVALNKLWWSTVAVRATEYFVEDASWLRLRNVYVSYSLPAKVLKPMKIKGADLTFGGRNLWLHTKYTGIDPEVTSAGNGPNAVIGIDVNGVPATKSWDLSLKIKF